MGPKNSELLIAAGVWCRTPEGKLTTNPRVADLRTYMDPTDQYLGAWNRLKYIVDLREHQAERAALDKHSNAISLRDEYQSSK